MRAKQQQSVTSLAGVWSPLVLDSQNARESEDYLSERGGVGPGNPGLRQDQRDRPAD